MLGRLVSSARKMGTDLIPVPAEPTREYAGREQFSPYPSPAGLLTCNGKMV